MSERMDRIGLVTGMPDAEYHNGPELSSTGARHILDSPARFAWRREHPEFSNALNFGKLTHLKVLGVGADVVPIPEEHLTDGGRLSTKKATQEWKASLDPDVTLMAPAELAKVEAIAEAVLAHDEARALLERPGEIELSAFATDPQTKVKCRARYDRIGDGVAVDLKTTSSSASPRGFGASVARYGYAIQEAFYADVYHWATGGLAPQMHFIVVETAPPHFVSVQTIPQDAHLIAIDKAAEARRIYAECSRADHWPAYPGIREAEIPGWWLYQNDDDLNEPELKLA